MNKGRVERGVDFVQRALKGRSFRSLAEENTFLAEWEKNVADTRIHGTTRRHVCQHFLAVEKPALKGLPAGLAGSGDELSRLKRELVQAEVKLGRARATVTVAELDIRAINIRIRELTK